MLISRLSLGVVGLLCSAAAVSAPSVTIVPDNANPLPGQVFSLTVQAAGFPGNGSTTGITGGSFTITFNSTVVALLGAALPTSPAQNSTGNPFDFITPLTVYNANTAALSVLRNGTACSGACPNPFRYAFGNFNAFVLTFQVLNGAPPGAPANIVMVDDGVDNSWTLQDASALLGLTYTQADGSVGSGPPVTDTVPDVFTFTDQENLPLLTESISNAITVSGIDSPTPISIGGDTSSRYSVNGAAYTNSTGLINNGDSIRVKHTSAGTFSTSVNTMLNIGGVTDTFTSTTRSYAFAFTDQVEVPLLTELISDAVTISGIDSSAPISISGDASSRYSVNGAAYTNSPGVVTDGDSIRVRHTSAGTVSTSVNTTLNIGGVTDTFTSTTRSYGALPDQALTYIDESVVIHVTANDIGFGNPVTVSIWNNPASGTVTVNGSPGTQSDITVSYLPNAGFLGSDSFEYAVADGARSDIATVNVAVFDRADPDHDGIDSSVDNCTLVANPDQFDADGDGYGNICDADLNNSGLVTQTDYTILRNRLSTTDPVADLNHSGRVTITDYTLLRKRLNTQPGPSGLHPNCPPACP